MPRDTQRRWAAYTLHTPFCSRCTSRQQPQATLNIIILKTFRTTLNFIPQFYLCCLKYAQPWQGDNQGIYVNYMIAIVIPSAMWAQARKMHLQSSRHTHVLDSLIHVSDPRSRKYCWLGGCTGFSLYRERNMSHMHNKTGRICFPLS